MQLEVFPDVICRSSRISACGTYRWDLRRWWRYGSSVLWIMLNPSTADAKKDDPTMVAVMHFTRLWGYGGCVVANLYPYRSSDPAQCRRWADWESSGPDWGVRDILYYLNVPLIVGMAQQADLIVAAWGAAPWAQEMGEHVLERIGDEVQPSPRIHCLGTTQHGAPKHPLARGVHRIPRDQQPMEWRR